MRISRGNGIDTMQRLNELYRSPSVKSSSQSDIAQSGEGDNLMETDSINITKHAKLFSKLDQLKRDCPDRLKEVLTSIISDALQDPSHGK